VSDLTIGWLYPTLMSTYGDRGNAICLQQRARWRGIDAEILPLGLEAAPEDFARADVILGGGAQDRQQELVMRDLTGPKAEILKARIEAGIPGAFTCGSPQLLGHYYEPAYGQRIDGLGLFDFASKHPGPDAPRCIGNVAFEVVACPLADHLRTATGRTPIAIGFENHGGRTYLGDVQPLGKVLSGLGNNGEDGTEGAFYRHAIATYAHGPLLPKNPAIADWLLRTALEQRAGTAVELAPLDDRLAERARAAMFARMGLPLEGMPEMRSAASVSG